MVIFAFVLVRFFFLFYEKHTIRAGENDVAHFYRVWLVRGKHGLRCGICAEIISSYVQLSVVYIFLEFDECVRFEFKISNFVSRAKLIMNFRSSFFIRLYYSSVRNVIRARIRDRYNL